MSNLAERIADLSPEKRELLLKRLKSQSGQSITPSSKIPTYQRDTKYFPLSNEQERLWFLNQLEERCGPAYHIPQAYRLWGVLNQKALEDSLNALIARHEILRTCFSTIDGRPYQQVLPPYSLMLSVVDLTSLVDDKKEQLLQQRLTEEARHPFELQKGPLLRVTLYHLDANEYVLAITFHHIIFDGWSMQVFWQELATLYEAHAIENSYRLPDLPIQYVDYTQWQRDYLTDEVTTEYLAYWQTQLANVPPILALPTDKSRPATQAFRGNTYTFSLSAELTMALKALSREGKATLFMTLLAAFKVLLYRYTGQMDIVVGTPEANRQRVELEGLIGFFVNTLILRTQISANVSFRSLLAQVREVTIAAYNHRDIPFARLVQALQPKRSLDHNPLYQVMFSLQTNMTPSSPLWGLVTVPIPVEREAAQVDLSLTLEEVDQQLNAFWVYNTDLFEAATIQRMAQHLTQLLTAIVTNPDQPVGLLPLLTVYEQQQILYDWNDTYQVFPENMCIHELFDNQASKTPGEIAVIFGEQSLTYQDLNNRANQLAHYLQRQGVGPEVCVAVCLEPSLAMVVSLLGILKAGGAYLPLDPTYPLARLAALLEESKTKFLITQPNIQGNLLSYFANRQLSIKDESPEQGKIRNADNRSYPSIICIEAEWQNVDHEDIVLPYQGTKPNNLAYVLFTSGSTGHPKGVMVSHSSLNNYLTWVNRYLLSNIHLLPVSTKLTFDACLKQLLAPLLCGGTVWLLSSDIILQPRVLVEAIAKRTNSGLNCVPLLWQSILDVIESKQIELTKQNLTDVFLGGEHLDQELVKRTFKLLPWIRVWNLYGPTETTANASYACMATPSMVSIGRPIANTRLYILDTYMQPVPIGVTGELYIGGIGVARGYLNQPGMTANLFVPHPFSDVSGMRLYKTGDLARFRSDGAIEFLGRRDRQIKLRGFRIEPGEIEAVLDAYPAVQKTLVTVRQHENGEARLVAYVILQKGYTATQAELRMYLQAKLPHYMVPTGFVYLEQLPVTSHGKIDLANLPESDGVLDEEKTFVPPGTEVENLLTRMWVQLLSVDSVSLDDDFFARGGHSLLIIQFLTWVKELLQVDVPLAVFFNGPTLANVAQFILNNEKKLGLSEKIAHKINKIEGISIDGILKAIRK